VRSAGAVGDAAFMAVERSGQFAAYFGIDIDNQWKVGGWSYGTNAHVIMHGGNSFVGMGTATLDAGAKNITTTGNVAASVLAAKNVNLTSYAIGSVSGAVTADWNNGSTQSATLTGATTITPANIPVGNILRLTIFANGNTLAWGGSVTWQNNVTPDPNTGTTKYCVVMLEAITTTSWLATMGAY
jgi:hypothetical protein